MRIEPLKLPPRLYSSKPLVVPIITDLRGPAKVELPRLKTLTPSELIRLNDRKVRASRLAIKGKTEPEFGFSRLPAGILSRPQANGDSC